jgi:HSP20 family protein
MKISKKNNNQQTSNLPSTRDSFGGIFSLRDAMDRLFDESFWSPTGLAENDQGQIFVPRVDISETESEIKVRADMPGINPDKVNIEVAEDSLKLSGSVEKSEEEKRENFYRSERQSGQFLREFILPSKIDPDSVEAKSKNGVISINLKKQPTEKKRKIKIKTE